MKIIFRISQKQIALFKLIQDWQKILDKPEGKVGAILMDLSKAFDCLARDLQSFLRKTEGIRIANPEGKVSKLSLPTEIREDCL